MAFGAGVYNPETQSVLIGETSPGGDINPSILAHELGHALSLRHFRERFNLMSGRQPGVEPMDKTRLSPEQIAGARAVAKSGDSFRRDRLERENNSQSMRHPDVNRPPERSLEGRYRIERELGEGGSLTKEE